jgi:hypothetical protein
MNVKKKKPTNTVTVAAIGHNNPPVTDITTLAGTLADLFGAEQDAADQRREAENKYKAVRDSAVRRLAAMADEISALTLDERKAAAALAAERVARGNEKVLKVRKSEMLTLLAFPHALAEAVGHVDELAQRVKAADLDPRPTINIRQQTLAALRALKANTAERVKRPHVEPFDMGKYFDDVFVKMTERATPLAALERAFETILTSPVFNRENDMRVVQRDKIAQAACDLLKAMAEARGETARAAAERLAQALGERWQVGVQPPAEKALRDPLQSVMDQLFAEDADADADAPEPEPEPEPELELLSDLESAGDWLDRNRA